MYTNLLNNILIICNFNNLVCIFTLCFLLDTPTPGGDMYNVMMKSVPGASMSAVCLFELATTSPCVDNIT